MTRAELEHAIRASCDVTDDSEVWVFGSQAILGEHPDAPGTVRQSIEVDIAPRNHPDRVDLIDGALGEYSVFHETYGFYVHGISIESAILPAGWEGRAIPVSGRGIEPATGWCIEGHDLAASKLAASREQDLQFVRTLIIEGLVNTDVLIRRVQSLAIESERIEQLSRWVESNSV
ncbi:DUF6036 family nucleotidyltransferase [Gemmatimonadota bacterium]